MAASSRQPGTETPRSQSATAPCPFAETRRPFPEEHLSGALDGVLTRIESSRVRQHVRECPRCRAVYEELALNRRAALTTVFPAPPDDQWDESPRGVVSRWTRNLGWLLFAFVALVVLASSVVAPEFLSRERVGLWLLRCTALATLAVLVSVGIDRWRSMRGDLYRGVRR